MKFVNLIFTILVSIKLYFTHTFDIKSSISNKNSPFSIPIFLENKSTIKKSSIVFHLINPEKIKAIR